MILPVGSVEEHGPHLPLGTDTFHALEVARRVAELRPVLVAPPVFYGICRSTREHPGTVSISGDTLRALLKDLGREFHRQGLRRLMFISGHAGGTHMGALVEAGEALLEDFADLRVAVVNVLELLREVLTARPDLIKTKGGLPRRGGGDGHHAGHPSDRSAAARRRNGPAFPNMSWCGTNGATGPGVSGATRGRPPAGPGGRNSGCGNPAVGAVSLMPWRVNATCCSRDSPRYFYLDFSFIQMIQENLTRNSVGLENGKPQI